MVFHAWLEGPFLEHLHRSDPHAVAEGLGFLGALSLEHPTRWMDITSPRVVAQPHNEKHKTGGVAAHQLLEEAMQP